VARQPTRTVRRVIQILYCSSAQIPCVPLIPSAAACACLVLLVVNSTLVGWIGFIAVILSGERIT
jgi:hypothetical protein